jgi:hypothetical protein
LESHRLVQEGGPRGAEWVLAWDGVTVTLDDPDGLRVMEEPAAAVHRLVDLYQLYVEGKVCFTTTLRYGWVVFRKQSAAVAAVRRLVEAGLAGDPEFRAGLRRESLRVFRSGLLAFVVCGGLFGLYCWFASWAPEPPRGHWIRWFGWAIHGVLLVLMGLGLGGLIATYFGLRQWLRVRRIERLVPEGQLWDKNQ